MFTYLNDALNQFNLNVFSDSSSLFDDIGPLDPHVFSAYIKFPEDSQPVTDRAYSPFDTSSDSSPSPSVSSTQEGTGNDSDSNHSISEKSNVLTSDAEKDVGTSITTARRRSWRSFRRTLPANLSIAPEDALDATPEQPPQLFRRRSSAAKHSFVKTPRRRPLTPFIFSGSDQDADGESDDGGSDDEYIPPPNLDVHTTQNLKRRRSGSLPRRTETSTRPSLPSNSAYSSHSTAKRVRLAPPSRNKQASQATSMAITRVVNNNLIEQTNFICPECGWRQINKRVPDFKRHLKTHLRPKEDDHSSGYWCKGVRVEHAREYAIQPDATPYRFLDHERIGGCMRTFSRRDALKRHLDNANISCIAEMLE